MKTHHVIKSQSGIALPIALFMIVAITAITTALAGISHETFKQTTVQESSTLTNLVAEGAVNKMISEMSLYSALWDQQASLSTAPFGYTEFNPTTYVSSNGIPPCTTGASCQRNFYPLGGGLIKNFGPLSGDGATVDNTYYVTDQLEVDDPATADITLGSLNGWVQVERLDEEGPSANTVGGNLSSALAEGGNAKRIRFRLNGTSLKTLREKTGSSTIVTIVLLPVGS